MSDRIVFARLADFMTGDRPTHNDVVRYARAVRQDIAADGHLPKFVDVELDNAKGRAGVFRPGINVVSFSRLYLDHASVESIEDTVLHEFAHACDYAERERSDHGRCWEAWCRRLGMTRVERCADLSEMSDAMPKGQYEATCPTCRESGIAYRWKISPALKRGALHNRCGTRVVWVDVDSREVVA